MPLENYLPKIDDRQFDDIMREVRTRIARYTPEWTDVNDNEPGMALLQVFSWLTEMLIYRLGKVPELNYLKFLMLLGIELSPAEPASAEITFSLVDSAETPPSIVIPERTQVAAESTEGGAPPLIFETERSLIALKARLLSIQAFDGYDYTDLHAENDEPGQGFAPFGQLAKAESALLLGFDASTELPSIQLNLTVWVFEGTADSSVHECNLPQTQMFPSAHISWEYWAGTAWRSLSLLKDETLAFTQFGHIYLKLPAKGQIVPAAIGRVTEPRYWLRARLTSSSYERPPQLLAIRTNTVAAQQAQTAQDEILGGSNGRPDQVFQLANVPVLHDSLRLEVDEGDGYQQWIRVDDFFGSSAKDRHYVLNRTTGEVRFGDGINGSIPVANVENPVANVVAREYRFGGGKSGNVAPGMLETLVTTISGVDDNAITNLQPAYGGRDEETLQQAKQRAPRSIKSRCRAVTAEDFEFFAMQAANVRRAKALPLFHPRFSPDVKVPGVVTVIVVPDSDTLPPMPSEGTLRSVCAYLNQRRLLTTEVYVIKPTYQKVQIRGEVIANDNADLAEVKEGIEDALHNYFHPLKGGEDGQGWPFGGDIFYSRVYQRVFIVPGVQRIEHLVIILDGQEMPECTNVKVPGTVLVYSTEHDIQVNYAFDQ